MDISTAKTHAKAATLGKYQLLAEIGHGGMASVYLSALQGPAGFAKLVVLKEIRPELADDDDFLSMFLDEARLAARLNHPNIVQTNEVGHDGGRYFIAMEYLEGQPYSRILARLGRAELPIAAHVDILAQALAGLHHAHELCDFDGKSLGVVHRDATPQNLFVTYDGQVKLVDFGIAKAATSSLETATGVMKGKIAYMSPEQARGERVDRRADIFAFGVMLWEAIAGRRMWSGANDIVVLQRAINGDLPSLRDAKPDVHPRLEAICQRAIAADREERYPTAADFQADLEAVLLELPDRRTLKDLGKLIAAHFEENRAKLKSIVEARLSVLARSDAIEDANRTGRLPVVVEQVPSSGSEPLLRTPASVSRVTGATGATPPPASASFVGSILPAHAPSPASSRNTVLLIGGAFLAAMIGGAAFLVVEVLTAPFGDRGRGLAPAAAVAHMIHIESVPVGATVLEGEKPLGATPLVLPLDPANPQIRHFVVSKAGYVPFAISQPPVASDVRVVASLTPEPAPAASGAPPASAPAASASPAAAPVSHVGKPPPGAQAPPSGAPAASLNIRTRR